MEQRFSTSYTDTSWRGRITETIRAWLEWWWAPQEERLFTRIDSAALQLHLELTSRFTRLKQELQALQLAIQAIPDHGRRLDVLEVSIRADIGIVNDKLEHVITDTPRLSLGMLMTWEAICFACDKFDRDQEAAYNAQADEGCCGSVDIEVKSARTGAVYLLGFNHGH